MSTVSSVEILIMTTKCPTEFYLNCWNASKKCGVCSAGSSSKSVKLYYSEIKEGNPHSYSDESKALKQEQLLSKKKVVDKKVSALVKSSLKKEITVLQRIADVAGVLFKPTLKSGAINGDGDGTIGEISVDHKYRTNSESFTVSKAEWEKGLAQGVQAWVITVSKKSAPDKTAVVLTEELFVELLHAASLNKK